MTDKIKVVHIAHSLIGLHPLKVYTLLPQKSTYGLLFLFGRPMKDKLVERRISAENIEPCIIDDAFLRKKLSGRIVY